MPSVASSMFKVVGSLQSKQNAGLTEIPATRRKLNISAARVQQGKGLGP